MTSAPINARHGIPASWEIAAILDLARQIATTGIKIKQKDYLPTGKYPVVDQGQELIGGYTNDAACVIQANGPVVVFGDHTKVVKHVARPFAPGADGIKVLEPSPAIDSKYFFLAVTQSANKIETKGYARHFQYLARTPIPLPPTAEQQRIVTKLEEMFSQLDAGIASLQTARAQLKVYRQALLKHAFEGKLTEAWRVETDRASSTASALLQSLGQRRRSELQIRKDAGDSEASRLLNKLSKHRFSQPSTQLPEAWEWASLTQAAYMVVDCHNKTAPYETDGVYLVRTTNIRNGRLNLSFDIRFVSDETYAYWSRRCPPESGDLLFTREAPMGEVAIIPPETTVCMGQRMMLIRPFADMISAEYLRYAILDPAFHERMNLSAIGTGVKHLRVGDVEALAIPICPTDEQQELVRLLDEKLSVIDSLSTEIDNAEKRAIAIRSSILKKAFTGQLVPQDPDDEPASALLARLRAERATDARPQRGRRPSGA